MKEKFLEVCLVVATLAALFLVYRDVTCHYKPGFGAILLKDGSLCHVAIDKDGVKLVNKIQPKEAQKQAPQVVKQGEQAKPIEQPVSALQPGTVEQPKI